MVSVDGSEMNRVGCRTRNLVGENGKIVQTRVCAHKFCDQSSLFSEDSLIVIPAYMTSNQLRYGLSGTGIASKWSTRMAMRWESSDSVRVTPRT